MRITALALCLPLSLACSDGGGSPAAMPDGAAGLAGADGNAGTREGCAAPSETIVDPTTASEIAIAGDPGAALGIFDVSPVYPAGAPAGALSYSAVAATSDISTRIAVSADQGESWVYVASANASTDVTVTTPADSVRCPGGNCSGRLVHEVSSLAFDPIDIAARRWKLYAHSYVVLGADELAYDWGYISAFFAPEPQGPWTFEGNVIGWNGEATLSSEGATTLASDVPDLSDCVALTEPGALVLPNGNIQLALGCATLAQTIRIVLFESNDHGATFAYRGVLLDGDDALCAGSASPQYNAAHSFFAGGKQYLLASATGNLEPGFVAYAGCHLFEMDAIGSATIRRSRAGVPIVLAAFDAAGGRFNGACAYAEGAPALGLAVSILRLDAPPKVFRTYATRVTLP